MMDDDPSRIERLRNEVEAFRAQLAEIQIQRMQKELATLKVQVAEVQSLRQAQDAVIKCLASQPEAIGEDRISCGCRGQEGNATAGAPPGCRCRKVNRTGTGKRGDPG